MPADTYGCSLSSDQQLLIVTTVNKTYLYNFHEEAGQVTLNEIQSQEFVSFNSVFTNNQKYWMLSNYVADQSKTTIFIYKETCARQHNLYYEGSTSTCQECTGVNEGKCLIDSANLCLVNGCHECSATNFCGICEDSTASPNNQGECVCSIFFDKLNPSGKCEPCFIAGCNSCAEGQD